MSKQEFIEKLTYYMSNDEAKKIREIENDIFNEYKDSFIAGVNIIRNKYEGSGINVSRVYRRIVNYKIARYRTSQQDSVNYKDLIDYKKTLYNEKKRKELYRRKYGKRSN